MIGTVCGTSEVSCSMVVSLSDRMGNDCLAGGANIAVSTTLMGRSKDQLREAAPKDQVRTSCSDNNDGSYKLQWQSEVAGTYSVSVTIGNVHLVGSPMELQLIAGPPDVDKMMVSGDGLTSAQVSTYLLTYLPTYLPTYLLTY